MHSVMTRMAMSEPGGLCDVTKSRDEESQEGPSWEQSQHRRLWEMSRRAPQNGKEHVGGESS